MSEKICPLMNMGPCAGQDCIFFLDEITITATNDIGGNVIISSDNIPATPCAFIFSGINGFIQFSSDMAKNKLS